MGLGLELGLGLVGGECLVGGGDYLARGRLES